MTSAAPHGRTEGASTAEQVLALKEEVVQLKEAMTSRATVDQAIGIVVFLGQLTPAEAWDVLRETSMRTNTKLRLVAEQLVAWGRTGRLAPVLRNELDRQLTLRRQERAAAAVGKPGH